MLLRMTFDSFKVSGNHLDNSQRKSLEDALNAAKRFAKRTKGWFTLFGGTGVGKTHLAVAIANEQMKNGKEVFFVPVSDLLDHLRFTYSPESTVTYDHLLEEVKNAPLLVLDDLGREHSTPWAAEKLYQIISHRYNSRALTVITATEEFAGRNDPIASRVKHHSEREGVGAYVPIEAPDYRAR